MDLEIQKVRQILANLPDLSKRPIKERRAMMDVAASMGKIPGGCSVDRTDIDGIPGEWIKPDGASEDKGILYLHGGGYAMGSLLSHRQMIAYIARAAGSPVLSLAYRLAPENPFPAAVEDAVAAYRWLLKKGFPPGRMAIAGDSAGGGLALAALLSLRDSGDPLPSSGICISPWTDLTCSSDTYRTKSKADPIVNLEGSQEFAALYLNGRDPKTPLASPLFADLTGLPSLLIQVGTEETLLNDSIGLDRKARAEGVDCTLEVWEEMIHVWHLFAPMLQKGREALLRIGEYFRLHAG